MSKFLQQNVFDNYDRHLVVLHQNIRSLRKNFDQFAVEIQNLNRLPDIIFLSEIWIEDYEVAQYKLPNFITNANCNSSHRAGGIILFISKNINCDIAEAPKLITADALQVKVKINSNTAITIVALYRLHNYPHMQFNEELDLLLTKIVCNNLILCGDINIDLLNHSNHTNDYLIKMASHGLKSLNNEPTRVTQSSSTCIDHIFFRCSANSRTQYIGLVIDANITDHKMTAVCITCKRELKTNTKPTSYTKIVYPLLYKLLKKVSWDDVYKAKSASNGFEIFIRKLESCMQASYTTKRHVNKIDKIKPWMSDKLLQKVETKNSLYKSYKKQPNNSERKQFYITFKNNLLDEIKNTKNDYYKRLIGNSGRNPSKRWKLIKEITGTTQKQVDQITLDTEDGSTTSDPDKIANIFNNFFSCIPSKLRDANGKLSNTNLPVSYTQTFKNTSCTNSIFLYPTTVVEIRQIILGLENRKAPGADNITPSIIKSTLDIIQDIIVFLVNLSLSSGQFPENLKMSIVKPLFKKGNKKDPSNYRPIALLSIFSKIIEKVVKKRLTTFLEKHNLLTNNQFGFRSGLNTEHSLIIFMSNVYNSINNGKPCAGLFIDIMKAFDTVDHNILLQKLHDVGIRGIALDWFQSFLKGRTQQTSVNGHLSTIAPMNQGVPQGSVLAGPLFLIYINDMCDGKFQGKLVAFADDTALFYSADTTQQLAHDMQQDLNILRWWFTVNHMALSPKTKYIIFNRTRNTQFEDKIKYHNINCTELQTCRCLEIQKVNEIKYLGIFLDQKVSWKAHIDYLKTKIIKYIRTFYMLRPLCTPVLLKELYHALVSSRMEYGIVIWGGTYHTSLKPLITLQKYFIRILSHKTRLTHTPPLFLALNILPFRNLYIFKVLRLFFNRSTTIAAQTRPPKTQTLRNKNSITVPKPNLTMFKHFFTYAAPHFYNHLPETLKQCNSKGKFTRNLKIHLINSNENDIEVLYRTIA